MSKHLAGGYRQLGEAMGVDEDRVKTLALGRAKTLRPSEVKGLHQRWGLLADWLHEGAPPTFGPDCQPDFVIDGPEGPRYELQVKSTKVEGPVAPIDLDLYRQAAEQLGAEMARRGIQLPNEARSTLVYQIHSMWLTFGGGANPAVVGAMLDGWLATRRPGPNSASE